MAETQQTAPKPAADPRVPLKRPESHGQRAPGVVPGPAAKPGQTGLQAQLQEAEERFSETGSSKDYARVRTLRKQLTAA